LGSFAIRSATEDVAQFYQVDPALVLACGGERRPVIDGHVMQRVLEQRRREAALGGSKGGAERDGAGRAAAENPQRAEVHVLMLYTPAVRANLSGDTRVLAIRNDFDAAIEKVNANFSASEITARVRL